MLTTPWITGDALVETLSLVPSLENLVLRCSRAIRHVVCALTIGVAQDPASIPCPRLRFLHLTVLNELDERAVVEMISSRRRSDTRLHRADLSNDRDQFVADLASVEIHHTGQLLGLNTDPLVQSLVASGLNFSVRVVY